MRQRTASWTRRSPPEDLAVVERVQERYREEYGVEFHALRSRSAGARRFVSLHVLVPGLWTVSRGHDLSEDLERGIVEALPMTTVFVHIEPLEDEASFRDQDLDREHLRDPPRCSGRPAGPGLEQR